MRLACQAVPVQGRQRAQEACICLLGLGTVLAALVVVMTKAHGVLALLVGLVLPGYSWLDGSGWLAWTMFSKSETYRIRLITTDSAGQSRLVNPTALAQLAGEQVAPYLSGAEHFRQAPISDAIAANLGGLAQLACRVAPGAVRADAALDSRKNLDAPVRTTAVEVSCL